MSQVEVTSSRYGNESEEIPVTQEQIEALGTCISNTLITYRSKRRRNKIGAITIQILSFIFSFGTTVLIGWKLNAQNPHIVNNRIVEVSTLTNFALIISALATGINGLDKFFDYKALWIGYNISIANLKSIIAKLDYLSSLGVGKLKRNQIDEIFSRYESICANMDKSYQAIRSARDE